MGTDNMNYDQGWWLDDVRIYTCAVQGAPAAFAKVEPANAATGHTWLMDKRMKTFYGPDAPGQIYKRENYAVAQSNTLRSNPVNDERRIDWYSLI
jgi:hypothetical protein